MNVKRWNTKYNIGTKVEVELDTGTIFHTKTRSNAWILEGHTPVIFLEGIRGAFALNRVSALVRTEQ